LTRIPLLNLDNVTKHFFLHAFEEKIIHGFEKVSFIINKGQALGLSGPSGSGKSSILKCIYRTYLPTHGNILFSSERYGQVDFSLLPERIVHSIRTEEIGYVSQFLRVIPRVPAIDVVAEPLIRRGISRVEAKRRSSLLLERILIPRHLHDAYPSTFSGGEQQRVNVARAVIWKPKLLLLDEPTASLDVHSVAIVMDLLRELKEEGVAMIGIFHNETVMNALVDRVYKVDKGVLSG
jgi:alpha-D-ribose 1-methylphosphonate 5-triphosphate synthase subunit PhnL